MQLAREHLRKKGRPRTDDAEAAIVKAAKAKTDEIKNSEYALGKAPEHLTENQQAKVAMIAENNKRLHHACRMKEMLRLLLKLKDVDEAETELKRWRWLWWASHSRIKAFRELYQKIKLIIRKAYGFRNIQNMLDMVYLVCSDLRVPLPNRKPKSV